MYGGEQRPHGHHSRMTFPGHTVQNRRNEKLIHFFTHWALMISTGKANRLSIRCLQAGERRAEKAEITAPDIISVESGTRTMRDAVGRIDKISARGRYHALRDTNGIGIQNRII